ncbi:MAG: OB-fold domain-containing protein, partial [Deltaproteobacteria bacterium]|nr:OB-fold domain-containing protein [Deltaproteobacteria bacterium]
FVVPHPPLLPQFGELAPYNVVLVALDEDPTVRLVGNLVARQGGPINEIDPASIEIGAALRVIFEPVTEEIHMPRWVLA